MVDISIVNGIINQLITGGHHLVVGDPPSTPSTPEEMLPRPVLALSHVCVAQVSCGHSHCCAVTNSGDVWAWGSSRTFGHTEQSAYPNVPTMIKADSAGSWRRSLCSILGGYIWPMRHWPDWNCLLESSEVSRSLKLFSKSPFTQEQGGHTPTFP